MNPCRNTIGWADYTWNVVTGCLGPNETPCSYCYARKLAQGRLRPLYLNQKNVLAGDPADPFSPRWWQYRLGEPEEVARCVVFLASDEAGLITGSTLSANGGQYFA